MPRAVRRRHEDDGGKHLPVAVPTSTATLGARGRLRNDLLEKRPQLVRHEPLYDRDHGPKRIGPNEMPFKPVMWER